VAEDRNDDLHIEPDDDADALVHGAKVGEAEHRAAAYARLMLAEQRLHDYWEQRSSSHKDWVGELVGEPVYEDTPLWLAALADKVAALGGHLELVAAFPEDSLTLLIEPGLITWRDSQPE
jgi:hypothetical protein